MPGSFPVDRVLLKVDFIVCLLGRRTAVEDLMIPWG